MRDAGLAGRLADFTLEEILQLIALQQKTGLLTVDASYPMVLAFEGGMLVGYRDIRRSGIDPLESYLKRYGFFGSESWEHVDFVQRHSRLDLTEILVNEALLTSEELDQVQFDAAQEDIFRGMQLRDGRYHFTPGRDGMAGLKGRVRIKVDGLLMEAVRRIDEIGGLRDRYFSPDLKVRRTEQAFDPERSGQLEIRILELLGDHSTVGEVVSRARMAEFDTLSVLEQLREDGLVTLQSTPRTSPQAEAAAARAQSRAERGTLRPWIVSAIALAAALTLAVLQPWSPYRSMESPLSSEDAYFADRDRARVEAAVQLFIHARQRPPSTLGELLEDEWIDAPTLERVQSRFAYRGTNRATWRLEPR